MQHSPLLPTQQRGVFIVVVNPKRKHHGSHSMILFFEGQTHALSEQTCLIANAARHDHVHPRRTRQTKYLLHASRIETFERTGIVTHFAHRQHKGLHHQRATLVLHRQHIALRHLAHHGAKTARHARYHLATQSPNAETARIEEGNDLSIIRLLQTGILFPLRFREGLADILLVGGNTLSACAFHRSGRTTNTTNCCAVFTADCPMQAGTRRSIVARSVT